MFRSTPIVPREEDANYLYCINIAIAKFLLNEASSSENLESFAEDIQVINYCFNEKQPVSSTKKCRLTPNLFNFNEADKLYCFDATQKFEGKSQQQMDKYISNQRYRGHFSFDPAHQPKLRYEPNKIEITLTQIGYVFWARSRCQERQITHLSQNSKPIESILTQGTSDNSDFNKGMYSSFHLFSNAQNKKRPISKVNFPSDSGVGKRAHL